MVKAREIIDWTEERTNTLIAMWKAGEPSSKIALAIGHEDSKNAIIGRARRLKLGMHPSKYVRPKPRKPKVVIPKVKERAPSIDGPPMKADHRFLRSAAWVPLEGSIPIDIMLLNKYTCRWPVNLDGSATRYCGLHVDSDVSDERKILHKYCASHRYLSNQRT